MKKPDKTAQDFAAVAGKVATTITAPLAEAMVKEIIDSVNDQLPGLLGTRRIKDGPLMKLYGMINGSPIGQIQVARRDLYNSCVKHEQENKEYNDIKDPKYREELRNSAAIQNTLKQGPSVDIWISEARQHVAIYQSGQEENPHTEVPFSDPNFETTLKDTLTSTLLATMLTPNEMKRLRERMGKQTTVDLAAQAQKTLVATPAG